MVNRSDDLQLRQASIDVFTEYRLLVEDRYPDVFVLTTEVLAEETPAPPSKPRKPRNPRNPRSKDRPRRRAR